MKRILITGGCGFVGRRFAKRFLDAGHVVFVVDNLSSGIPYEEWAFKPLKRAGFDFIKHDIRNFSKHSDLQFDLVLHCAAVVGGRLKIEGDIERVGF